LQQSCPTLYTHTQAGGGEEGGNKDSQPQPTTGKQKDKTTKAETGKGAHNTQAEQRKENGVACRRAIGAKQNRQQSKTTAARKLKQDGTGEERTHFQGLGRGRGVCSRSLFVKTQKAR